MLIQVKMPLDAFVSKRILMYNFGLLYRYGERGNYLFIPGIILPIGILFMVFIISRIWSNCFINAFTSEISFPQPFAILFFLLPSIKSGLPLSSGVIEFIMASIPLNASSLISI